MKSLKISALLLAGATAAQADNLPLQCDTSGELAPHGFYLKGLPFT